MHIVEFCVAILTRCLVFWGFVECEIIEVWCFVWYEIVGTLSNMLHFFLVS